MNGDALFELVARVAQFVEDRIPNASSEMKAAIAEQMVMDLLYPTQEG